MVKLKDFLYDDDDARIEALQAKKELRRNRRRKGQIYLIVILVVVSILYFCSSASKVHSIKISGNTFYSEQAILDMAKVDYESHTLFKSAKLMEYRLEKNELIEEAIVEKSLDGRFSIKVKEALVIGYFVEKDKNYVLLQDGSKFEIKSSNLDAIVNYPLIDGFSKKEMKNLAASFSTKKRAVSQDVISMISEIRPFKQSYDEHMVKIVMQDGNTVFTSYDSLIMLNDYKKTLEHLTHNHVCFWMDINTDTVVAGDCKGF